jgi:hypothetical protein
MFRALLAHPQEVLGVLHAEISRYVKETGLEVNADKTKYMVMSQYQNVGRSHSTKIDNSSFERVEGWIGWWIGVVVTGLPPRRT